MEDNESEKTDIENTSASSERNLTQRYNLEAEPIDIKAYVDRAKTQAKLEHAEIQMNQEIRHFNSQKNALEANSEEAESNI